MNSDLEELYDEFFQECFEYLDIIESILVEYDGVSLAKDKIDEIFRGAHSIKGGSGMFDFKRLNKFTHDMETLLDKIRQEDISLNKSIADTLLKSVDSIRQMIESLQNSGTDEVKNCVEVHEAIIAFMSIDASLETASDTVIAASSQVESDGCVVSEAQNKAVDQVGDVADIPQRDYEPAKKEDPASNKKASVNTSIRVNTGKVDNIINMVGELVITQSMLSQQAARNISDDHEFNQSLAQLEHNVRDIQESIMEMRMMPMEFIFKRFPRLVREVSKQLDKDITLKMAGQETEIDRNMMEKIVDPLVHLMRNSIDHGIEMPSVRVEKGKKEQGQILLSSYHKGGSVYIDIEDDGKGIDAEVIRNKAVEKGVISSSETFTDNEKLELIFLPGLSTAESVSDLSGRGVGMDVVKKNISSLGGSIHVESELGRGSRFSIRLPLTLSIVDGQLFRVGKQVFIVPVSSIIELILVEPSQIRYVASEYCEVHKLRDDYIPIKRLHDVFKIKSSREKSSNGLLIVVESKGKRVGLFVDELLSQQQVVIKSLDENYKRITGIPAATILGDGHVALIVDVDGIFSLTALPALSNDVDFDAVAENEGEAI